MAKKSPLNSRNNPHPTSVIPEPGSENRALFFRRRATLGVIVMFGVWSAVTLGVLHAGRLLPGKALALATISVLGHLSLAAWLTAYALMFILPHLFRTRWMPWVCLFLSALAAAGLFWWGRIPGAPRDLLAAVATANLIWMAVLLGALISIPVKRPVELIPLGIAAAVADVWSITGGPTAAAAKSIDTYYSGGMKGPAPWVDAILMKVAVPGSDHLLPVCGVADWIIVSFFSATAAKFQLNDNLAGSGLPQMIRRGWTGFYLPVAAFGLMAAVLAARLLGIFVPALPVVGIIFLIYMGSRYPAVRRMTPKDWRLVFGAVGVVAAIGLIRWVIVR